MKRILLCLAVTLGLCLGLGTTAQASPAAAPLPAGSPQRQIPLVEPFLSRDAGGAVRLDAAGAVAAGADRGFVVELGEGLEVGNGLVAARTGSAVGATAGALSATEVAAYAACAGRTRFLHHWYGYELWVNACDARAISALAAAGGSAATIAGGIIALTGIGIPLGAAIAIAGGVIAIGGAAVQWCNRYNRGVVIYTTPARCKGQ